MRNKIGILVIIVFVIGAIIVFAHYKDVPNPAPRTPGGTTGTSAGVETTNPNAGGTAKTYTLADVAKHNSGTSCWTAINGSVYDVTSWVNQHPGGPDAILSLCGTDGSTAFNGQHGGQAQPAQELATFKIGSLSK